MTAGSTAATGGAGKAGRQDLAGPDRQRLEEAPLDLAALVALEEPARDGRVARGQRTRRNVAEALMELLRAGDPDPTAKAVARRAGVSLRLVFHHFADMDDLYQFVAALQLRRQWADMPQLSPRLSLSTRIERTVAHRAALFEETLEIRRALDLPGARRRHRCAGRSLARRHPLPRRPAGHLRRRAGRRCPSPPGPNSSAPWTPARRGKPGNACARRRASRYAGPGG